MVNSKADEVVEKFFESSLIDVKVISRINER